MEVYHLDLDEVEIKESKFVFLPGAPERVPEIAKSFDPEAVEIAWKREYRTWLGKVKNIPVLVTSTGIGGSSTSIAIDELAQLGVKTFIRIGTTGAIQDNIKVGDVIITTGAVRLDGASTHYAPIEYPAVADYYVTHALIEAAKSICKKANFNYHVGITASSATFYPGQERYDSYSGYVIKKFRNSMEEWQKLHVLNYEMESATLLTLCSSLGLKSGCITGVVVNRTMQEQIDKNVVEIAEQRAIEIAIKAMRRLIESKY